MVVSVSRRSDVPRFYFPWFMDRVREGRVDVPNPFDARKARRVSLLPADVDAFVFWTRDPGPALPFLDELDGLGHRYYFMTTVTGYPAVVEPGAPDPRKVAAAMGAIAARIGRDLSIWRYDPVFLSAATDEGFHRDNFGRLAEAIAPASSRVVLSLYDEYRKSRARVAALAAAGAAPVPVRGEGGAPTPAALALLGDLAAAARARGLEARACAEAADLSSVGLLPNACVDAELMRRAWGLDLPAGRDRNQRPACRCAPSVDVGRYDTCPAGCVYCYATASPARARARYQEYISSNIF